MGVGLQGYTRTHHDNLALLGNKEGTRERQLESPLPPGDSKAEAKQREPAGSKRDVPGTGRRHLQAGSECVTKEAFTQEERRIPQGEAMPGSGGRVSSRRHLRSKSENSAQGGCEIDGILTITEMIRILMGLK